MKKTPKITPKVAFLGLLSINKDTAWTCPNGQVNRGKDLTCWDKPCGCGAKQPKSGPIFGKGEPITEYHGPERTPYNGG